MGLGWNVRLGFYVALSYVSELLSLGLNFCSFDFSGCGNSDGDHISFGCKEKHDVECVIQELMIKFGMERFVLWGRSMGAVACIKYAEMMASLYLPVDVVAIVLDSPFKSLKQLII